MITTKLWSHQIAMHDFVSDRLWYDDGYAWLLAGCGTGKTLVAYAVMQTLDVKRMLVLTTKAAALQAWVGDAQKHTEGLTVLAPVGKSLKAKVQSLHAATNPFVFVMNYESAWRMTDELRLAEFDMVVADESHKLQGHDSKQSTKLARLCMGIPYKLAMTGTGWDNSHLAVFGQVRWLDPCVKRGRVHSSVLGTWTQFFDNYTRYYVKDNIKIPTGAKNLPDLNKKINPFTLRVDSEVVLDLPPELHIERVMEMPKPMKRAYEEMHADMVAEIDDGYVVANSILEKTLRLHQITSGFIPLDGHNRAIDIPSKNPKLLELEAILDEIDGKPLVVFMRFLHDMELITRMLDYWGITHRELSGRAHQHVEWQAGAGQVLLTNIQAGSEGVDLTRARYGVYYSLGHSRTNYTQSLARIRRPGADLNHPVTYFHLIMKDTIDEDIRCAMIDKGKVSDRLLKGLTR